MKLLAMHWANSSKSSISDRQSLECGQKSNRVGRRSGEMAEGKVKISRGIGMKSEADFGVRGRRLEVRQEKFRSREGDGIREQDI